MQRTVSTFFIFFIVPTLCIEYYVSPTVNQCHTGTLDCPFSSLSSAVSQACSVPQTNTTLYLLPGTYPTQFNTNLMITCPLSIKSINGSSQTFFTGGPVNWVQMNGSGDNVTIQGITFNNFITPSLISITSIDSINIIDIVDYSGLYNSNMLSISGNDVFVDQVTANMTSTNNCLFFIEASNFITVQNLNALNVRNGDARSGMFLLDFESVEGALLDTINLVSLNLFISYISSSSATSTNSFLNIVITGHFLNPTSQSGNLITSYGNSTILQNIHFNGASIGLTNIQGNLEIENCTFNGFNPSTNFINVVPFGLSSGFPSVIVSNTIISQCSVTNAMSLIADRVVLENVQLLYCFLTTFVTSEASGVSIDVEVSNSIFSNLNVSLSLFSSGSLSVSNTEISSISYLPHSGISESDGTPIFKVLTTNSVLQAVSFSNVTFSQNTLTLVNSASESFNHYLSFTLTELIINNCTFFDNHVLDQPLLSLEGVSTSVTNSSWYNNDAGTIISCHYSSMMIDRSLFLGNHAQVTVIELLGTAGSIQNTFFLENHAENSIMGIITIKFSQITLDNLNCTGNFGNLGGVVSAYQRNSIHIMNSVFDNNHAYFGAAVYTGAECNTTVTDCVFQHNEAYVNGGAFYTDATAVTDISNSIIFNNSAAAYGGAYVNTGNATLNLYNVTLTSNSALYGGGIVYDIYSKGRIANSTIANCFSRTSGGGVYLSGYTIVEFLGTIIEQNTADSVGSGAFIESFSRPSFIGCSIRNNYNPNDGGGVYCQDGSESYFQYTLFESNYALSSGGGVLMCINSTGLFSDCIFRNNSCGSKGGAISLGGRSSPLITNCLFENNIGVSAAALYGSDNTSPTVVSCNFINNTAFSRAGAAYLSGNIRASFIDVSFINNTAVYGPGGAIVMQDFSIIELLRCDLTGNVGTYGGGIYAISNNNPRIENSTIARNGAHFNGGGLFLAENSTTSMHGCTCINNTADGEGGCLMATDTAYLDVQDSSIYGNVAGSGAGLSVDGYVELRVINSVIVSNTAENQGGAIYITDTAYGTINSTLISYNYANLGGGIYQRGSNFTMSNLHFYGNSAQAGGGLFLKFQSLDPGTGSYDTISFTYNTASIGGAIALISTQTDFSQPLIPTNNITSPTPPTNPLDPLSSSTNFFFNTTLANNTAAVAGGAIYLDTTSSAVPGFTDNCMVSNNFASGFGGGLFIAEYSREQTFMNLTVFDYNFALFGGGNVGIGYINAAVTDIECFCSNCSYALPASAPGYQNAQGFATVPFALDFIDSQNSCPHNQYLNAEPVNIQVYLFDQIGNIVKGNFVLNKGPEVTMNVAGNVYDFTVDNQTVEIDYVTGSAAFTNFLLIGKDNSTAKILFSITSNNYYSITSTSCSILLYGCPPGDALKTGNTTDTCVTDNKKQILLITAFVLVSVILTLLAVIFIIAAGFIYVRVRKMRKRAELDRLEIPDFEGKPSLTLLDILSDPLIKHIPWSEITLGRHIGKGASGLVSAGIWKVPEGKEQDIALKELILGIDDLGPEVLEEFLIEIKFMSALVHKNIVTFLGISCPDNSKLYLITELMHFGSLRDLLDKKGKNIQSRLRLKLAKDAAKGVAYLHSKKLIHRDLKTHNLLVNNSWVCKVADFGISTVKPAITRTMTCIGTPVYMAPEVLSKNKYSEKADVYSFGVVLMEIITGARPYADKKHANMNHAQLMYHIVSHGARPSLEGIHPCAKQLILDCWNDDPRLRPSFAEIVVRLRRMNDSDFSLIAPIDVVKSKNDSSDEDGDIVSLASEDSQKFDQNSQEFYNTDELEHSGQYDLKLSEDLDMTVNSEFTMRNPSSSSNALPSSSSIFSSNRSVELMEFTKSPTEEDPLLIN